MSPANPLKLRALHHVELWTGNAKQAAYYYRQALGFSQFAYAGLETGSREVASYALHQGKATLVVSTPLSAEHPMHEHLRRHGDAVRDIAFHVDDARHAFEAAVERGARPIAEPQEIGDGITRGAIATYGDTIHSLISKDRDNTAFLPGFQPAIVPGREAGILRIDHIVGNVELGRMEEWADFYARVCGFHRYINFDDKDIST
ncbi:MAG TPA: VOC family protein, partial [Bryobacteraceae bacterium]|nr:VOC family protein [Bryobacteraceae bacterium]